MKIDDLLKVLDMSEVKQVCWFTAHNYMKLDESLALMAFRLRDEVLAEDSDKWAKACWQIHQYVQIGEIKYPDMFDQKVLMNAEYWVLTQKPIVWIVTALYAALITKESQ